jgi:hypothetical protein
MKIREKMSCMLVERGIFPRDAATIISKYVEETDAIDDRIMDEDVSAYPPQMLAAVFMGLKSSTVEWIDANCPGHWARPLFVEKDSSQREEDRG